VGGWLFRRGVSAKAVTGAGWTIGVVACVAVRLGFWVLALVAWLLNRVIDGIDGAVARREGATDRGGYLDLMADFSIYSGFVVAVAVAMPAARLASAVLLFTYYLSGAALLAASGLLDRTGAAGRDERSIRFLGGLAEGVETTIAYVLIIVASSRAALIEWVFAAMVFVTAIQRVVWASRALTPSAPIEVPSARPTNAT
jgi:phosphatidylserine synthase